MTSQPTKNILFQHNLNAYRAVTEAFRHGDRAAVVHATGTGKSYIIEAVAKDYGRAAVIAPNNYVLDELRRREIHADLLTYPTVMSMKTYPENRYDLIVLDEFHRAGAEWWGLGVACLLEANPEAKVLGTSATEIRYLDGARNMADELFEGNVVSRLPLTEAWLRGILPVPKYVVGLFNYEDTYKEYSRRISVNRRMSESDIRSAREILEKGRLKWETSHGVASIFRNHLPADTRRLIVFCDRTENLPDVQYRITQWLAEAGFRSCNYTVHYRNPESETDMADFRDDDPRETGVKVLFAIDMLNEGVHVPDVEAVVLLRPTCSKNVFLQQIGRCMNAGTEHQPVILDLVDNLTATSEVERLRDEYNAARKAAAAVNDTGREMKEFIVTDYVKDIRDLIYSVNAFRPVRKMEQYLPLLEHYVKEERRWPKNNADDIDERNAAHFAYDNRNEPEITALREWAEKELGIRPWRKLQSKDERLAELSDFLRRERRWPSGSGTDRNEANLRAWITKHHNLKPDREVIEYCNLLAEEYGLPLNIAVGAGKVDTDALAEELNAFLAKEGRWPAPSADDPYEKALYHRAQSFKNAPPVAAIREKASREYGVSFRQRRNTKEENIRKIKEFVKDNGRWPMRTREKNEETKLAQFAYSIRNEASFREIIDETGVPMSFKTMTIVPFDESFADLEAFVREKHRWPIGGKDGKNPDLTERALYRFYKTHRKDPRITALLKDAESRYGFTHNLQYDTEEMLAKVRTFITENRRWPSSASKDKEEAVLGSFLTRTKKRERERYDAFQKEMEGTATDYRKKTLYAERVRQLEEYVHREKKWPRQDQESKEERSMAKFASRNANRKEVAAIRDEAVRLYDATFRIMADEHIAILESFIETHRRFPSQSSDIKDEKKLAIWAKSPKNPAKEQVKELREKARKYETEQNESDFEQKLKDLEAFIRRTGKWPTHHTDDRETYGWGYFVNMNRKDPRVIALKKHFRTKSDVLVTAPYEVRLKELRQFVTEKGRLPEWNATDPFEKGLYYVYISKKNKPRYREDMAAVAALAKKKTAT